MISCGCPALLNFTVSLQNGPVRFAMLSLPAVDVAIMLRAGTLRVGARLGDIALEDLSEDEVINADFKKLLSIEGDELADFSYETFDPNDIETFPGYNSSVYLRTGSLKFTFMEKPIHDLYAFGIKFARMKAIYDAASQAAVQRASEVTRMRYDVVIKTPIIILPRDGSSSPDVLLFQLGEISAKNEYLKDTENDSTIQAGLQGINVASEISVDDQATRLQLVDDVAITANIKQASQDAHRTNSQHAENDVSQGWRTCRIDFQIEVEMSDVKLSLTQRQYMLVMELVEKVTRAFSILTDADVDDQSIPPTPSVASGATTPSRASSDNGETLVDLEPELAVPQAANGQAPPLRLKLNMTFAVPSIAFEIYALQAIRKEDLKSSSIARFALLDTHLGLKQLSNGAMEAEVALQTLSFVSTRSGNSVFRDIIPPASSDKKQL